MKTEPDGTRRDDNEERASWVERTQVQADPHRRRKLEWCVKFF